MVAEPVAQKERDVRAKSLAVLILMCGLVGCIFVLVPSADSAAAKSPKKKPLLGPFPTKPVTLTVWDWVYGAATSNPNDPTKNRITG